MLYSDGFEDDRWADNTDPLEDFDVIDDDFLFDHFGDPFGDFDEDEDLEFWDNRDDGWIDDREDSVFDCYGGTPFEPIRMEGTRPIFDDRQILNPEQLVPGMVLECHDSYDPEPVEQVVLTAPYADDILEGVLVVLVHDKYGYHEGFLGDRSVNPTGFSSWNAWHYWTDTGRRVDDAELQFLQTAFKGIRH